MQRGKLILVIGPTGSGKGTLIRNATEKFPALTFLDSYTTRPPRPSGVESSRYRFISVEEFRERVTRGDFLEWAEFSGNFYGTLRQDVTEGLATGKIFIKEMDLQGVHQVERVLPKEEVAIIFVDGGPWDQLAARAVKRAPMDEKDLALRKARYGIEMASMAEADIVIRNYEGERVQADMDFEAAIAEVIAGR